MKVFGWTKMVFSDLLWSMMDLMAANVLLSDTIVESTCEYLANKLCIDSKSAVDLYTCTCRAKSLRVFFASASFVLNRMKGKRKKSLINEKELKEEMQAASGHLPALPQ